MRWVFRVEGLGFKTVARFSRFPSMYACWLAACMWNSKYLPTSSLASQVSGRARSFHFGETYIILKIDLTMDSPLRF